LTQEVLEAIRALSPIESVVGDYVSLRRAGFQLVGLCPFHDEGTASFTVNPEKQVFFCHGCGVGGDVFRFIQISLKCGFREGVAHLAQRAGLDIKGFRPSPEFEERVVRIKAQRIEEQEFQRFWHARIDAINAEYRAHCRAATWAENCLRLGILTTKEEHELAWNAFERYRIFEARVECEGICDMEVLRAEWKAMRGNRDAAA
jgi:DNA primase